MELEIVVAADAQDGIGKDGRLPWRLPGDMRFFRRLTTQTRAEGARNAVLMGRRTWDSLPPRFRPLPRRLNLVLSRNPAWAAPAGVWVAGSLERALDQLAQASKIERAFVIGGAEIYRLALPRCRRVHLTRVLASHDCDAFFPPLDPAFERVDRRQPERHEGLGYVFEIWEPRADR